MKSLSKPSTGYATLVALLALFVLTFSFQAFAGYTETQPGEAGVSNEWRRYEFFASTTNPTLISTTGNATSSGTAVVDEFGRIDNGTLVLRGAESVSFYFTRNGASNSTATSTFSVQVSPDGTTWIDYNKLISNTTNTNAQNLTRVSSVQLVGPTSTSMVSMDLIYDSFHSVRCVANFASTTIETSDSNECQATVKY